MVRFFLPVLCLMAISCGQRRVLIPDGTVGQATLAAQVAGITGLPVPILPQKLESAMPQGGVVPCTVLATVYDPK